MANKNRWPSEEELRNSACARLNPHIFQKHFAETPEKARKGAKEKMYIHTQLLAWCQGNGFKLLIEHEFVPYRKFRFDWAVIDGHLNGQYKKIIAVEYEGIYSKKSRHTVKGGYDRDADKYNIASQLGWSLRRYTAATHLNITEDLRLLSFELSLKDFSV